jgi:hypothetical protein
MSISSSIANFVLKVFASQKLQAVAADLEAIETKVQTAVSAEAIKLKADVQLAVAKAKVSLADLEVFAKSELAKVEGDAVKLGDQIRAKAVAIETYLSFEGTVMEAAAKAELAKVRLAISDIAKDL